MLQYGFAHFISTLKSTLFWFVAVSFFIYFHPQNIDWYQRRIAKKKEKEAKEAKKAEKPKQKAERKIKREKRKAKEQKEKR